MPLSNERVRELRDHSEIRIEKTRETKRKKKAARREKVYEQVAKDLREVATKSSSRAFTYIGERGPRLLNTLFH